MSRLDLLILFMERLETLSATLVEAAAHTAELAQQSTRLHLSLAAADAAIGTLSATVAANLDYLRRLGQLHERSFFLEASFAANDPVTNQTAWLSLHAEFEHLDAFRHAPTATLQPHTLSNSYSVSNIRLKPIRCREKKAYKKKLRYRLSQIYNINPLASSPIPETPGVDSWSDAGTLLEQTQQTAPLLTLATSPETSVATPRVRSNSVPDLQREMFDNVDMMRSTNIMNRYHDESEESLRFKRLRHFVSINDGLHTRQPPPPREAIAADSSFIKTPVLTPIESQPEFELLDIDQCSDFSYYSPDKLEEDNFEHYLRKSRLDLHHILPNVIKRSSSHDSIFACQQSSWKFHNPVDKCVAAPTIKVSDDSIYFQSARKESGEGGGNKPAQTVRFLSDVILKDAATPVRNAGFSLFDFATNSPFTKPSIQVAESPTRPAARTMATPTTRPMPIAIAPHNEAMRQPPVRKDRTDGTHSSLTIGPNKTRIFTHGEQSYFKRPLASKVSQNSLHEALNFNML